MYQFLYDAFLTAKNITKYMIFMRYLFIYDVMYYSHKNYYKLGRLKLGDTILFLHPDGS